MTRPLSILVDLDGIVADLHGAWYERALLCCGPSGQHATVSPAPPTLEEVLEIYDGWGRLPCGQDHVFDHLDNNLFEGLDPIAGALEALRTLKELGHEVTIVTASAKDCSTAAAKLLWVERHLGWSRHSVMIVQRKQLVRGDVFIDDAPKNLATWLQWNPDGAAATIAYPYNTDVPPGVFRAESWKDTAAAWDSILEWIVRQEGI